MKRFRSWELVVAAALLLGAGAARVSAQEPEPAATAAAQDEARPAAVVIPAVRESDWSGPRIGFMAAPGDAAISRRLRGHGLGNVVSLFGWHFEHQVTPVLGGPQLVTEVTPLFGGVEYGKVVPSVTLSIGLRSRGGYEIGMGPSLTLGNADSGGSVALAIAAGRSLDFGGVRIPLNLAVSTNPKGTMVSVLAGYSIPRLMR